MNRLNSTLLRSVFAPLPVTAMLVLALVACSSGNPPAAGASADDAGQQNGGGADAAPGIDGSSVDAGSPTQTLDAAEADAPSDTPDSASVPDSAVPYDGGAGPTDSASAPDTNVESSPYSVSCTSPSAACAGTPLVCESFGFGGGAITGYACTKTCTQTTDCGAAPAGFGAVACETFTTGGLCVLTCDASSATSCPAPQKCAADEGQALGICVSF